MPSVLAGTAILENTLGHLSQAEGIVKLPVGEPPASEVILEPWNSSFNRRSKTTRRHPGFDSPIGCAISAAPCMLQLHDSYSRIAFSPQRCPPPGGNSHATMSGPASRIRFPLMEENTSFKPTTASSIVVA